MTSTKVMKRWYILCDIDHTLSAAFTRDHMIGGEGGWDAYHAESIHDLPIIDVIEMVRALWFQGYEIIGMTARPAKWRAMTLTWMIKHQVPMDELLMRPDTAFHPAPEIKVALAKERFGDKLKEQVAFIIDDREDVCAAFRELGITALQCYGRQVES